MAYETPDFDPSRQIRVLVLEPGEPEDALNANFEFVTLETSDDPQPAEHQKIEWDAISYSWDGQERSLLLDIGGKEVRSTPIVQEILRDLRCRNKRQFLWVDALCINQEGNEEKSLQVPMMLSIFEKARSVVAWLRLESYEVARAVAEGAIWVDGVDVTSLTDEVPLYHAFYGENYTWRFNPFLLVLDVSWLYRIWVIQEAVVSRNLFVRLAGRSISWELVGSTILRFRSKLPARRAMEADLSECCDAGYNHMTGQPASIFALSIVKLIIDLRHWFHNSNTPMAASHLVALCRNSQATLPVDMIYGVCGLFGLKSSTTREKKSFPVDYRILPKELYKSFTVWCMEREGTLDVLVPLRSRPGKREPATIEGLPSWAVDWPSELYGPFDFSLGEGALFMGNVPKPLTPIHAPIYRVAGNTLVLRGFVVDTMLKQPGGVSPDRSHFPSPFWRDGASADIARRGGVTGFCNAEFSTKSGQVAYTSFFSLSRDPLAKVCALYGGWDLFVLNPLPGDRPKGTPLLYTLSSGYCYMEGLEDGKGIEFARERGLKEEDFHIV